MGQTLSEPIVEKHTSSGSDKRISWASSEMQGWRISNSNLKLIELINLILYYFSYGRCSYHHLAVGTRN